MLKLRYFTSAEFDDPTAPGTGAGMDEVLLMLLDEIREECGFPFVITSGFRTTSHNAEVGGEPNSEHLTGNAADILCTDGYHRFKIVQAALKHGIRRIGVKKDCIHLGNGIVQPQNVIFTYD